MSQGKCPWLKVLVIVFLGIVIKLGHISWIGLGGLGFGIGGRGFLQRYLPLGLRACE